MTLVSIDTVAEGYGVSVSTIRRWVEKGLLSCTRTLGGHRRFEEEDDREDRTDRLDVGYARVSSHDQKEDLSRQIERLKEVGCGLVISDIGSGLNCRKPGLRRLLTLILERKIRTLTVTHEDRPVRFGTLLIRFLCARTKTEVRVLNAPVEVSFEAELAKDAITLMTVFCARLYGRRSRRKKKGVGVGMPVSIAD